MILHFIVVESVSKVSFICIWTLQPLVPKFVYMLIRIKCFNAVQFVKVVKSYWIHEIVFLSHIKWRQRIVHYIYACDFREGSDAKLRPVMNDPPSA